MWIVIITDGELGSEESTNVYGFKTEEQARAYMKWQWKEDIETNKDYIDEDEAMTYCGEDEAMISFTSDSWTRYECTQTKPVPSDFKM